MLAQLLRRFAAWRRYRATVRRLEAMDDRLLADMGIKRATLRQQVSQGQPETLHRPAPDGRGQSAKADACLGSARGATS